MVVFFSTTDRENLTIENVNECTLNRNEDLNKFFRDEPNNSSENPPNLSPSAPTAPQENEEAQTTPPKQDSGESDQTDDEDTAAEERPPVTVQTPIVDIPLCVPITSICVR